MHKAVKTLIGTTLIACSFALAGPVAASETKDFDKFVQMCDANKDGMVSKDEFMKHVDKMWAKMDTKKVGKMDAKQFEQFLKELMKSSG